MKENIGILDSDLSFARVLCERINEDGDFPYYARMFPDKEELFAFLDTSPLSLLLLSADREDEEILKADIPKIGYLSDVKGYASMPRKCRKSLPCLSGWGNRRKNILLNSGSLRSLRQES